jgi:hypothetical protein
MGTEHKSVQYKAVVISLEGSDSTSSLQANFKANMQGGNENLQGNGRT